MFWRWAHVLWPEPRSSVPPRRRLREPDRTRRKPERTPVERPTRFEIVINLKTAKLIGLTFSQAMLLRADDVIEQVDVGTLIAKRPQSEQQ
jgi:hypothetical protein